MNMRNGVFLKYVADFRDAGLKVSNDPMVGDACIDGDVSVRMSRGTSGGDFQIVLHNLPEKLAKCISDTLATPVDDADAGAGAAAGNAAGKVAGKVAKPPSHVLINLGYFDTEAGTVMEGICESVVCKVAGDELLTTISGREMATYACQVCAFNDSLPDGTALTYAKAIEAVLKNDALPKGCVKDTVVVTGNLAGDLAKPSFQAKKVMGILGEIAKRAQAELMVVDGQVVLGAPILYGQDKPAVLDPGINLASFNPFVKTLPGDDALNLPTPVDPHAMKGFSFVVLGDPKMRPGHRVSVNNVVDYPPTGDYRIRQVQHLYDSAKGYTCKGVALLAPADGKLADAIDAKAESNAFSIAGQLRDYVRSKSDDNPVVEVCEIKDASQVALATLYYGQPSEGDVTQPSISVKIEHVDKQVYKDKPFASPFAWRKCGLVTPAYAGMRSVVVHNRALASDGIVSGHLWSKAADCAPPAAKTGDWWLCLPTDFDATQPPTDSTSAANDLTANDGRRVIELKGLKLTVGAAGMSKIGDRPAPGDAEVCTIAHASGTVVTIKDGEIDVDTGKGPKLTLSASGITMTDGTLNVKLANGQLAIG